MKRIRYLSLLLVLLGSINSWAQDDFNPTNPSEPGGPISPKTKLTLVANPTGASSSLSGGGSYTKGTQVSVSTKAASSYRFVNWTDKDGTVISTTAAFTFTKGERPETLTANFEFDPSSPGEPADINQNVKYWLRIVKEEGAGNVTSSARYKAGTSVTVSATAQSSYTFAGWYDADGNLLGNGSSSYTITMPAEEVTLTAKFDYTPDSPGEPGQIKAKHILTLAAEEGGSVSADSYRMVEGESTTITATPSTGFEFAGWYKNGILYTESNQFEYVMGASNAEFVAHFTFNPSSPTEPSEIKEKKYAFYMMNVINKPGATVQFPVYLTTREVAKDMTFQLNFPNNLLPNMGTITLSEAAAGYTLNYEEGEGTESHKTYIFTLTAGESSIAVGTTALLTFSIDIPADIETAKGYPVTINQVSVSDIDNNTQHAGTKNGRVSVYKNGDTNGDDMVNITDKMNLVQHVLGATTDIFIEEVSDVSGDGEVNITDAMGIIEIILNE